MQDYGGIKSQIIESNEVDDWTANLHDCSSAAKHAEIPFLCLEIMRAGQLYTCTSHVILYIVASLCIYYMS